LKDAGNTESSKPPRSPLFMLFPEDSEDNQDTHRSSRISVSIPGTLDIPPPPPPPPPEPSSPAASAPASSLLMRIARCRHATAAAPFALTLGIVPKTLMNSEGFMPRDSSKGYAMPRGSCRGAKRGERGWALGGVGNQISICSLWSLVQHPVTLLVRPRQQLMKGELGLQIFGAFRKRDGVCNKRDGVGGARN